MKTNFFHFSFSSTDIVTKRSRLAKRIICSVICLLLSTNIFAQKDVTKFLGIPVDGTKSEMRQKLIKKGFKYDAKKDYLTGEFNGRKVHIFIVTNNNKVYRIGVADADDVNEAQIKIRYNNLVNQFLNNDKYLPISIDTIDDIDISYEMSVNNKQIEAYFTQASENYLKLRIANENNNSKDTLTAEQLQIYTDILLQNGYTSEQLSTITAEEINDAIYKELYNRLVWFTINELRYGEYYISIFYDNNYNKANGEDL
jgi:uncharacterized protein (DUF2141 family)